MITKARRLVAAPFRLMLRAVAATGVGRNGLARMDAEILNAVQAGAPPGGRNTEQQSAATRDRWHTGEPAPPYAQPGDPPLERLNCLCRIEDWDHPALTRAMRRLLPYYVDHDPAFPKGLEHRKHWEFAQALVGLEQLGALRRDGLVLAVGAGREEPIFDLTTRVRWVFATDIYGAGSFSAGEADARMPIDPDYFARSPYNRNRLVVEQMDALDLRFEDCTFDAIYSLSAIEHFGAMQGATQALGEMARVLKPGGIVALTTECIVNDAPSYSVPGQELFTPDDLRTLCSSQRNLLPVQELDFSLSKRTRNLAPVSIIKAIEDAKQRHIDYPHILVELEGRVYTSFSVFLKKASMETRSC